MARIERGHTVGDVVTALVHYLWQGFEGYVDRHGTLAHYPGQPSIYGARNDAIEGVTRGLPLWSAYLTWSGADAFLADRMRRAVARALDHGTDPRHPGYWGAIGPRSTLICEAADVALAAWLLRDELDTLIDSGAKARLAAWLVQAVGQETADNNWHLFVAMVDAVLCHLRAGHVFRSADRIARVESFRLADGCFRDGPNGRVDFYNAWGFHYAIFWLRQMRIGGLPPAWNAVLGEFWAWYRELFSGEALPLFGRSLCYRFATPVPLLAMAVEHPHRRDIADEAARRFANITKYFAAHGGLRRGCFSQGVLGPDTRWLDPYSGPASALWGARAAIVLLYGDVVQEWTGLPCMAQAADAADFEPKVLDVAGLNARILADPVRDHRTVEFRDVLPGSAGAIRRRTVRDRWRQLLGARAARPQNNLYEIGWRRFGSGLREYR